MSLLGQGVVAIWNDVASEGLAEFYEWHHREHMPERVGIPGFLRGRRYIAVRGAPEFFTLYEATGTDVLAGPHYLERLNNPTPLTRHVIPKYFHNMVRGVCDVRFSVGVGEGGWLITLRFAAKAGHEDELSRHLAGELPSINDTPTILGVHLCIADARASKDVQCIGPVAPERRSDPVGRCFLGERFAALVPRPPVIVAEQIDAVARIIPFQRKHRPAQR